jgi:hypothetical protein
VRTSPEQTAENMEVLADLDLLPPAPHAAFQPVCQT